ncbi:hypothetical protein THAOC_27276, partial [Thalassiosira oceanica]
PSPEGEEGDIPASFRGEMERSLAAHFGHGTFRPGQLAVLHALLGGGAGGDATRASSGRPGEFRFSPLSSGPMMRLIPSPANASEQPENPAKTNKQNETQFQGGEVALLPAPTAAPEPHRRRRLPPHLTHAGPGLEAQRADGESRRDVPGIRPGRPGRRVPGARGRLQARLRDAREALPGGFRRASRGAAPEQAGGGHLPLRRGRVALVSSPSPSALAEGRILRDLLFAHKKYALRWISVSEWGHDFRPHFLEVGPTLRDDPVLSSVPILALTATAVPRVQADIARSLRLRPDAAVAGRASTGPTSVSPSVGVPATASRREVDEVSAAIAASVVREVLSASPPGSFDRARAEDAASARVRAYHAGLPLAERHDAHTDFLVGRASVVVATVAFGMGIDKPDIRRVVHWGGCKTVEEYYQQIGRAGRDGLTADCIMYADTKDFVRYEDDFYLGRLGPEARAATMRSLGALREYAMDTTGCRRASLLEFFDETPSFGRHCGTCDLCLTRERHGDDLTRDFQNLGARVLLFAILAVPDQAMTTVKKVLGGGAVEGYRYARGLDDGRVSRKIDQLKGLMKKKRPVAYYEELLPSLVGGGPYTVFSVTAKGRSAAVSGEIVLPVPQSVREQERLDEEKRLATLRDLESKGVSMDAIPQEEIDEGDGEAIRALKRWHSYVDSLSDRGLQDKVNAMDDLRGRIEGWRLDAAGRYRMAPGEVLQEHLLVSIAYAVANLAPGQVMTRESLIAAGVRSNGIDDLTSALGDWTDEYKAASPDGGKGDGASSPMRFDGDGAFVPSGPWRHSVYKPNKKTGKATWELSYDRFMGPQRDSPPDHRHDSAVGEAHSGVDGCRPPPNSSDAWEEARSLPPRGLVRAPGQGRVGRARALHGRDWTHRDGRSGHVRSRRGEVRDEGLP